MRIKSYFVESVEDAIDKARAELGPDAMLMNSRRSASEASHLGTYEVVFAIEDAVEPRRLRVPKEETKVVRAVPPPVSTPDPLATQIAELKRQLDGVKERVAYQTAQNPSASTPAGEVQDVYYRLIRAGFSETMVQELIESAKINRQCTGVFAAELAPVSSVETKDIGEALAQELRGRIRVDPSLGKRFVMLVGAPGVGKTAAIAKLAITEGLSKQKTVHLISADSYRAGSSEQLRAYAGVMGAGFDLADSVAALEAAVERATANLVLIDTPGFSSNDVAHAAELAEFCRKHLEIEVQLVLPVQAHALTLARSVQRFLPFGPTKIIATFLDEAEMFGGIVEQAVRTGLPLSYMTFGQGIPEDIKKADAERLLSLVIEDCSSPRVLRAA